MAQVSGQVTDWHLSSFLETLLAVQYTTAGITNSWAAIIPAIFVYRLLLLYTFTVRGGGDIQKREEQAGAELGQAQA